MATRPPITSCMVDDKSAVFFVDDGGFIHMLIPSQAKDFERAAVGKGRTAYNDSLFQPMGQELQSTITDMAAISYMLQSPAVIRTRLFYADQNLILQGYEKDSGGAWGVSGIGNLNIQVAPNTGLTAVISSVSGQLKVYYYKTGAPGKPWVAWWTDGVPWDTASC